MVRITKDEAMYLRSCKRGGHVAKTTHKKYFVTEEPKTLELLRQYRERLANQGGKK